MQTALRAVRLGGLTIYVNYTWIFASVLILWWVALLWLPENFPTWGTNLYWLFASAVLVLYFFCVVLHEAVHSAVGRRGPRSANLYPFGAAVPFRPGDLGPARAILAALAAPLFNLILGVLLLLVGNAIPGPEHLLGWLRALLVPLGLLNLWAGALNLIPGTPFDGGLALSAAHTSFSGDREGGLALTQSIGRVATLALVLLGAWRGLTSDLWLQALALVVVGWSAKEAAAVGQQRRTLRDVLSQMKASDFMEVSRPDDAVRETDTVADLVRAHPRFPPNTPLAVLNAAGDLVGVTTLAATDRLMQGTWPATPVRAIATPVAALQAVGPSTSLVDVLGMAHVAPIRTSDGTASEPDPNLLADEEPAIPVIESNRLLGSIAPARLQSFEEAGRQFGIEETLSSDGVEKPRGLLRTLGALLPAIIVLAAMSVLGNIALHTDPVDLQEASASTESGITFSNFRPADGDIVGFGEVTISVQIEAQSPVVSATLMIDNQPRDTQLSSSDTLTRTASTTIPGLTLGQHTARINAVTDDGDSKTTQWRFRIASGAPNPSAGGGTATPATGAEATPSVVAAVPLQVARYIPALGGRVPVGVSDLPLRLYVKSGQVPTSAKIFLDGQELSTEIQTVSGADGVDGADGIYRLDATAPPLHAGMHVARAEITGSGGAHSISWTFAALQPDDDHAYFKETGYFVGQPFLKYWQENGGLGLFGYPISDLVQETDKASGEVYTAQYFERARFEQHPSLGNQVVLGRLGALLHEPQPGVEPKDGTTFFPQTGHNVSPAFLKFWNENGGLGVFGYPITEEQVEKNPTDGKDYAVQYFERNRFELHPDKAGTPFEVQLGLLGTQLYRQKYGP
ncbi:MAG: hypothetical protein ABI670_11485 [Chloroflexota bacterium]